FSSRRRHTCFSRDWSSDVCSSDLAALAIIREIGVEAGGCNIQFAINPADGEMLVVEMNPHISRSSALASKATGFPIARIGAKLEIGRASCRERCEDVIGMKCFKKS